MRIKLGTAQPGRWSWRRTQSDLRFNIFMPMRRHSAGRLTVIGQYDDFVGHLSAVLGARANHRINL